MFKNINKDEKIVLKDQVEYQQGQVISKTLVQNDKVSVTIFSFDKGEEIFASGGDALVTVLDGVGRFTVGGKVHLLKEGETLIRKMFLSIRARKNSRCSFLFRSKTN